MEQSPFKIISTSFSYGEEIPQEFTKEGANKSPPLRWEHVPSGAKELVLICEDPDAVKETPFVHWLVYNIPVHLHELSLDAAHKGLSEMRQGKNSNGEMSYMGPKPPEGTGKHRYYFKLYAIDKNMNLPAGLSKEQVMDAIRTNIIGETEFMGKYWYH